MQHSKFIFILLMVNFCGVLYAQTEESEDFIEFNDRRNVVHGVYLGLSAYGGEIGSEPTGGLRFKAAYVANQKLEVGLVIQGFESNLNFSTMIMDEEATGTSIISIEGRYLGLHLEPILFHKSRFNISFPITLGGGYINGRPSITFFQLFPETENIEDSLDISRRINEQNRTNDSFWVAEPGINILYNISRYVQLEAGVKYRFTTNIDIAPEQRPNVNGFSAGFGLKVGVFNLGRNRYKKNLADQQSAVRN